MHALQIVEEEPACKELVETGEIGEKEVCVEVGETLLYRFVEPFRVRVHLGGLGIGMVVREVETPQRLIKMLLELTPVVGQNKRHGKGEDLNAECEELSRRKGCMGAGAERKAKSGVDIFKRDDIAPHAISNLFKGV